MSKYFGKNVDYDAMLLEDSDEEENNCPICSYYEEEECEHEEQDKKDCIESEKIDSMVEAYEQKCEEFDPNFGGQ